MLIGEVVLTAEMVAVYLISALIDAELVIKHASSRSYVFKPLFIKSAQEQGYI